VTGDCKSFVLFTAPLLSYIANCIPFSGMGKSVFSAVLQNKLKVLSHRDNKLILVCMR